MTTAEIWSIGLGIVDLCMIILIFTDGKKKKRHKKHHPRLVFNINVNNKNCNYMSIISSLTLTSVAPVELSMSVVDSNNGNAVIAGTLSGLTYVPGDATQDLAVPDTTNSVGVDIHAVSLTGGTSLVATGNFVSTALQADGVTPVVSGTFTATLTIVNNVVVAVVNPVLVFNQ